MKYDLNFPVTKKSCLNTFLVCKKKVVSIAFSISFLREIKMEENYIFHLFRLTCLQWWKLNEDYRSSEQRQIAEARYGDDTISWDMTITLKLKCCFLPYHCWAHQPMDINFPFIITKWLFIARFRIALSRIPCLLR